MNEGAVPFVGTEAVAAGLSRRQLARRYEAVYRNVYIPKGQQLTAASRAKAAWLWSGRRATLAGLSAAAVQGTRWIDAGLPAELFRRCDPADGILIYRDKLADDEVTLVNDIPCTTPARTAYDLGRRGTLTQAVIRLDALAQARRLSSADVHPLVFRHRGAKGIVQLRKALDLMDGGAESPQETRTRLLLVRRGGLLPPETQIAIVDEYGRVFARLDMGWTEWKVGVEYDGVQHWVDPAQRTWDIDRAAELATRGWTIIGVSSDLLKYRPNVVITRVREALYRAGYRDEIRLDAHESRKAVS